MDTTRSERRWGDDGLEQSELNSTAGTWSGRLFENRDTGFPLSLVWAFTFDAAEVERDFGRVSPSVGVDWVSLPGANWSAMAGRRASASVFAEPIEASVYFFEHHRYESTDLRIHEQAGTRLRATANLSGDLDGLGLDRVSVEARLDFDGIYVQPETKPSSVEEARDLLAGFTNPIGLSGVDRSHNYLFGPPASEGR